MPLPLIVWGIGAAVAAYSTKKTVDAHDDSSSAKSTNHWAKTSYEASVKNLEVARENAQSSMNSLGNLKFSIWEKTLIPFVSAFSQIKNIDFDDSNLLMLNELPVISPNEFNDIQAKSLEMQELVVGGITALGTGGLAGLASYGAVGAFASASTGASIAGLSGAAASNATLAWLGGGSLATGGGGIAAGTAVLGGLVAAPVLVVGSMVLASKAEAAKEDALANLAKTELVIEEMKTAVVITNEINLRFEEMILILNTLNNKCKPLLEKIEDLVNVNSNYTSYSDADKKGIMIISNLAKTIKNIMESPLIDDSGNVTSESKNAIESGENVFKMAFTNEEIIKLEPTVKTEVPKKSLETIFEQYLDRLNDGSYIYSGDNLYNSKVSKKVGNAIKSYANSYGDEAYGELLVLVDITLFGSGKEGFYITTYGIYTKPFLDDQYSIPLSEIKSISHSKANHSIRINSKSLSYTHNELDLPMKAVVECIQEYLEQN